MPTPAPRREKRRSKGTRGDLLGSTPLHTESRPSMLSADRIALTQHSGNLPVVLCADSAAPEAAHRSSPSRRLHICCFLASRSQPRQRGLHMHAVRQGQQAA